MTSEDQLVPSASSDSPSEVPFHLMVEAMVDYAVFMVDPSGSVMSWNAGAERIKDYRASEVIGRNWSMFYTQEDINRGLPNTELAIATEMGRFEDLGWRIRKDGTKVWVRVTITALRDPAGQLIGFFQVTRLLNLERELAWRKRELVAAEVKATLAQLRSITDSISDGIVEVDGDWIIQFGNRAAAFMLPDFGIGRSFWTCFPGMVGTPVEQKLREAMRERCYVSYENFYAPYKIWLRVRVSPSDRGIAISLTDISNQKELEEKVQLERTLGEKRTEALSHMAAGLAHEISNPLAIIHATASELCLELATHPDDHSRYGSEEAQKIVQVADRAGRILKGLRGFAREAEQDPMEYASIYEIVRECLDLQYSRFERESIMLEADLPEDLPPFMCRETQIGQIITNLLNNAFDAITNAQSGERWVRVEAYRRGDCIVISVVDSGPGVADHFRAHIMEAFFTSKSKGLGMGIGLSLSQAIAESHHGTLVLAQGGPPTRIELTLPLEQQADENAIVVLEP